MELDEVITLINSNDGKELLFSFTDLALQRKFQLYLAGVIFHVLQAGALFLLITLPSRDATDG